MEEVPMDIHAARTLFQGLEALGHATCWLGCSRDLIELSGTDAQTAASVHALAHATSGLMVELGAQLRALEQSPDAEVRVWASLLLDRFRREPCPSPDESAEALDA
jgi:hypothetical protein